MNGWIKVHRSLIENPKRVRSSRLALWLYILLSVNHTPGKTFLCGKEITLNPGQGVFSTPDLARKLCESVSVIRRSLEWFESEQQIEQRKTNQGTVITVLNWDKYQQSEQPNEQRVNNDCTTSEQRVNNLPYYTKNDKNGKNGEKGKHKHGTYKNVLLSDEDIQKLQAEFPGDWQRRIERLSEYMASTGKSYKDHLATIRAWARKDAERNAGMGRQATGTESEIARIQDAIRRAQEEQRTATMGTVPTGGSVPNQGVRTGGSGKPPV